MTPHEGRSQSDDEKIDKTRSEGKELIEEEFYDASEKFLYEEENLEKKPSWKQRRIMKRMRKALLKLRNRGQIEFEVNLTKQSPKLETKPRDQRETKTKGEKKPNAKGK